MLAAISYKPIPILDAGPLALSLHGVFAGIGFVVGTSWMVRRVRQRGFDGEQAISAITWALVGAILGMRLFTVPAHLGDPGYGFSDIIDIAGDYSILGGYAGGIIAGVWRMRMFGAPVKVFLDAVAPGLAIGAVIGRIGDLAIVEHLGSPTSFLLGYTVKPGYDLAPQHDVLECTVASACGTYHHTALYDGLGALVLLGVILYLARNWKGIRYGQLFAVWTLWYGLQRFLVDFARLGAARDGTVADSVMGPFTGSQWGALATGVLGALLLWWFHRSSKVVSPEHDAEYGAELPSSAEAAPA